jgi:predicted DNA-binding protein (MmcQ/YjbR family)
VGGKMYLLISLDNPDSFNVKCDPERAVQWREEYHEVQPGFHMNKSHWNTVYMTGSLTARQLCEMIDLSYDLVFQGLPKKVKEQMIKQ